QAADAGLQELRTNIEGLHARRSEIEVDLVRKESDLKYLDETSRKELGCLDEAERGYQEVKNKIEALGPINPEALAEYDDAQQRHDFLTAQRQDLLDSIRD